MNKNIENIIAQYDNLQSYNIEEENPIPNELMTAQILKKNPSSPFHDKSLDDQMKEEFPVQIPISNDGKMEIEEENGIKKGKTMQVSPYSQRLSGDENPASMNEIDPSQQNLDNEKQSSQQNVPDNASKMELEENLPLNELLESTISLRNVGNASMLSISYFNLGAKEEHKKELETISEVLEKFLISLITIASKGALHFL